MKRKLFLFVFMMFVCFFTRGNNRLLNKSYSEKDEPFVERIKQSTLVVVLLEENQKYFAKLTKKGKNNIAATYSNSIKTYNDNVRAMVPQFLKISSNIAFKTLSEIEAMSVDERCKYSYLLYDRAPYYTIRGSATFGCNLYFSHKLDIEQEIGDYEDAIQFECLDSAYTGQCECRKLHLYAPLGNEKELPSGELEQNLVEIVPTQADLKICLLQLQRQFDFYLKNENSTRDEQKAMIAKEQQNMPGNYDIIKQKTLLICLQDLDKNLTADHIASYYPYNYKVVSKDEFDKAITNNNGTYCALLVSPIEKVSGLDGGSASIRYRYLIIDLANGNTLYMGTSEHSIQGTIGTGGNETVTEKNLKELTKKLGGSE
jgi:hypothetical protein